MFKAKITSKNINVSQLLHTKLKDYFELGYVCDRDIDDFISWCLGSSYIISCVPNNSRTKEHYNYEFIVEHSELSRPEVNVVFDYNKQEYQIKVDGIVQYTCRYSKEACLKIRELINQGNVRDNETLLRRLIDETP